MANQSYCSDGSSNRTVAIMTKMGCEGQSICSKNSDGTQNVNTRAMLPTNGLLQRSQPSSRTSSLASASRRSPTRSVSPPALRRSTYPSPGVPSQNSSRSQISRSAYSNHVSRTPQKPVQSAAPQPRPQQQAASYSVPGYGQAAPSAYQSPQMCLCSSSTNHTLAYLCDKCNQYHEYPNQTQQGIQPPCEPCLEPQSVTRSSYNNFGEQPTRDVDYFSQPPARPYNAMNNVPSPKTRAASQIPQDIEATCLPCGHTFPEATDDCWRVKIMKDVGTMTIKGMYSHVIQTQTSETRIVDSIKLEELLPTSERYVAEADDVPKLACRACIAANTDVDCVTTGVNWSKQDMTDQDQGFETESLESFIDEPIQYQERTIPQKHKACKSCKAGCNLM